MFLNLGYVVWHVINHVHVQIIRSAFENFSKSLSCQECHTWAVHPGIIRRGSHAFQVIFSFLWVDSGTGKL